MKQSKTVDWNDKQLMPMKECEECGKVCVPYGRTSENGFLCSKKCCDAHDEHDKKGR